MAQQQFLAEYLYDQSRQNHKSKKCIQQRPVHRDARPAYQPGRSIDGIANVTIRTTGDQGAFRRVGREMEGAHAKGQPRPQD